MFSPEHVKLIRDSDMIVSDNARSPMSSQSELLFRDMPALIPYKAALKSKAKGRNKTGKGVRRTLPSNFANPTKSESTRENLSLTDEYRGSYKVVLKTTTSAMILPSKIWSDMKMQDVAPRQPNRAKTLAYLDEAILIADTLYEHCSPHLKVASSAA